MHDDDLMALVKRVDPSAVRLPSGIKAIAAAIEAAERERCAKMAELHSRLTWNDDRKAQSRVIAAELRRDA